MIEKYEDELHDQEFLETIDTVICMYKSRYIITGTGRKLRKEGILFNEKVEEESAFIYRIIRRGGGIIRARK